MPNKYQTNTWKVAADGDARDDRRVENLTTLVSNESLSYFSPAEPDGLPDQNSSLHSDESQTPAPEPGTTKSSDTPEVQDRLTSSVGVITVHGIGDQSKGQHLTQVTSALVPYWTFVGKRMGMDAQVVSASITDPQPYVEVLLTTTGADEEQAGTRIEERLLFAEAWWARSFPVPSFKTIARWSMSSLPIAFAVHVQTRYEPAATRLKVRLMRALWVVLGIPVMIVVQLLLLALTFLAILPIKWLREWVVRVQRSVAESIGDAYVFSDSLVQLSHITTVLNRTASWLLGHGCDRIIALSHSQGAALSKAVFGTSWNGIPVHHITYGSGERKLQALQAFSYHQTYEVKSRMWTVAFVSTVGLTGIFFSAVQSWALTPWYLILVGAFLIFYALGIRAAWVYVRRFDSRQTSRISASDYFATSDPVPSGPPNAEAIRVNNTGQTLSSHSAYWDNTTEFVPLVGDEIARYASGTSEQTSGRLARHNHRLALQRAWLVGRLRKSSVFLLVSIAAIIAHMLVIYIDALGHQSGAEAAVRANAQFIEDQRDLGLTDEDILARVEETQVPVVVWSIALLLADEEWDFIDSTLAAVALEPHLVDLLGGVRRIGAAVFVVLLWLWTPLPILRLRSLTLDAHREGFMVEVERTDDDSGEAQEPVLPGAQRGDVWFYLLSLFGVFAILRFVVPFPWATAITLILLLGSLITPRYFVPPIQPVARSDPST